jgi:tRNA(Ile)-lysidine synthase
MQEAVKHRPALVLSDEDVRGRIDIDAAALSLMRPALARRLVRTLAAEVAPASTLAARHLEAVCRLAATDKPDGHLDLPGLSAQKRGDTLTLARALTASASSTVEPVWPPRQLDVPGVVVLPEAGLEIEARAGMGEPGEWERLGAAGAAIQAGAVRLPLSVRNRRAGDRFRPLGAPGRRKLQDVLVDRKVPRTERDRVPVIVDADDRIVWVAGVAVAHDCRVTAPAEGVLILKQRNAQ